MKIEKDGQCINICGRELEYLLSYLWNVNGMQMESWDIDLSSGAWREPFRAGHHLLT